jgi:hypothetical protein
VWLELCAEFHFLLFTHTPNHSVFSEHKEDYSEDVITLRPVETWTAAFDRAHTELTDLLRPGRARDIGKVNAVLALIEADGCLSQKKIAQMPGIHQETVKCILRNDGNMRKMNFRCCIRSTALKKLLGSKFGGSYLISWTAPQTEVCRMCTLAMKRACPG